MNTFRINGIPVFLFHVITTKETMLNVVSDESISRPSALSPYWAEFVPEIAPTPNDIIIAKTAQRSSELHIQKNGQGTKNK